MLELDSLVLALHVTARNWALALKLIDLWLTHL